jgi:protein phosphatase-4 regulatory subunit 3
LTGVDVLLDDPEYSVLPRKHRDFVGDWSRFKKVVDFRDEQLERKIHQTFRAQYLKDVAMARIVEDSHFSVLSSIIIFNQVEILNQLGRNQELLGEM